MVRFAILVFTSSTQRRLQTALGNAATRWCRSVSHLERVLHREVIDGTIIGLQFAYGNPSATLSSVTLSVPGITRTTTLTNLSGLNVSAITDPDTKSIGFGYVMGTSRIETSTNKRGTVSRYLYDLGGKVVADSIRMPNPAQSIGQTYRPQETQGIASTTAINPALLYTRIDGPRTVADTTVLRLNRFGAPTTIVNALGDSTVIRREDTLYSAPVTMLRRANGFTTFAEHDIRGNVTKTTDVNPHGTGQNAITQYTWDSVWSFATRIVTPAGDVTEMAYDPVTGNRLWEQDARGTLSRTSFHYYSAGTAFHQLRSVHSPMGAVDSVMYDATRGNVSGIRTPRLAWTTQSSDNLGRVIAVRNMVDSLPASVTDSTEYDVMDRVTRSVTLADPLFGVGAQKVIAVQAYDDEGQLITVTRTSSDMIAGIGPLVTQSTYDAAGRRITEVDVDNKVDRIEYDAAGNIIKTISRTTLDTVTMTYDVVNRLIRRVHNERVMPGFTEPGFSLAFPKYRFFTSHHSTPADTATFTYDNMGNMRKADNKTAIVRRTYYPNGLLATDSMVVRGYPYATPHWYDTLGNSRYGLGYQYDLNGRRTALLHGYALSQVTNATTKYSYDALSGELAQVRDPQGNVFTFTYDGDSRLVRTQYPGGVKDTSVYNVDGQVVGRTTTTGFGSYSEVVKRDIRGKITKVTTGGLVSPDTSVFTYSAMGHLIGSQTTGTFQVLVPGPNVTTIGRRVTTEGFDYDPFGNQLAMQSGYTETIGSGWRWSEDTNGSYTYSTSTGRLATGPNGTTFLSDWTGNLSRTSTPTTMQNPVQTVSWSWYDALGKLRYVDKRSISGSNSEDHFDEFHYDALGRLVLSRSRAVCQGGFMRTYNGQLDGWCVSTVRRTMWDGAQIAWELQFDGQEGNNYLGADKGSPDLSRVTGRVGYVHAGGIDRPLAVLRSQYKTGPTGTGYSEPAPFVLVPHYTWRGGAVVPHICRWEWDEVPESRGLGVVCLGHLAEYAAGVSAVAVGAGGVAWESAGAAECREWRAV